MGPAALLSSGLEDLSSIPFPSLPYHSHRSAQQEEIWEDCPHFQLDSDTATFQGFAEALMELHWICWKGLGLTSCSQNPNDPIPDFSALGLPVLEAVGKVREVPGGFQEALLVPSWTQGGFGAGWDVEAARMC